MAAASANETSQKAVAPPVRVGIAGCGGIVQGVHILDAARHSAANSGEPVELSPSGQ